MSSNTVHMRSLCRNNVYNIVRCVQANEGVWSLDMAKGYNVCGEKSKENIGT